jgi:hypothetical protein
MVLFEAALKEYAGNADLEKSAIQVWGKELLNCFTKNLGEMINAVKDPTQPNFKLLEHLVCFFRFRVARGGQGIAEITGGTGRCFHPDLRAYNLYGIALENMWGVLLLPYAEYVTTGPAPKGRMERQVANLLSKRK